jgi:D-alanyl-D-alanine carboxypeptidase-like protein/transglycosylase-like protein with SLT domain
MRPDVALAFDRMDRAARADGVALVINSAFRSDAEQAELWRRHPDPRWVAPPGKSLHRNGTELDLGPPGAYGWLRAHAERFHFVQRYSWEAWHWGYVLNPGSSGWRGAGDGERQSSMPDFVPARFAPMINRAAQRWSVSAALLAAQLYAESNFNPFAQSRAGAQGIAQFMPGTAAALGLENPFDAERAIDAQAHLMPTCCDSSAAFRSRSPPTTRVRLRSPAAAVCRRTRRRARTLRGSSA